MKTITYQTAGITAACLSVAAACHHLLSPTSAIGWAWSAGLLALALLCRLEMPK